MISNDKYFISLNSWHNLNSLRLKFYNWLYETYKEKSIISVSDINTFTFENNYSKKFIDNEIIGSFYAGFLKHCNGDYVLTERAQYDFNTFFKESKNISRRLGFTFDLSDKYIKALSNYTMTEPKWLQDLLKGIGFTLNKSKFRYMKKYKRDNINFLINDMVTISNEYKKLDDSYEYSNIYEMMKQCGEKRKNYGDLRCYINHFGMYDSRSVLSYEKLYLRLVEYVKMPIDWGGLEFSKEYIVELCDNNKCSYETFLNDAILDGMIRSSEINKDKFTITGKCYTIVTCINYKFHLNRLSLILEIKNECYYIYVGDNTLYPKKYKEKMMQLNFQLSEYWYFRKIKTEHELVEIVKELMDFF